MYNVLMDVFVYYNKRKMGDIRSVYCGMYLGTCSYYYM